MTGPRIGSLFSGYGGLDMAVELVTGGTTVWHSEIDPGACKILAHRFPDVPNLGDITAVDWSAVEPVDVLCGGSPCQDLSPAGKRGGMTGGTRSNLWVSMREAIAQLRPRLVVWENVRGAYSACADSELGSCPGCVDGRQPHRPLLRAVGRVLGDFSSLGFDAEWVGLRAADVGAPHGRFRVFLIAWPAADANIAAAARLADASQRGAVGGAAVGRGGHVATADAARDGRKWGRHAREGRDGPTDHGDAHPHAAELGRWPAGRHDGVRAEGLVSVDWGPYSGAIRRWERRLGRPAPAPTELSAKGSPRLSPVFVEWLMGLPAGWVTDVPGLTRNEQLKALGNGVVPQQAAEALRMLLPDVARAAA